MKREPTSEESRLIDAMNGKSLPWCREAAFRAYYGSVRVDYMMANYAKGKKEANAHDFLLLFDEVLHDVQSIPVKSVTGEARSRYGMAYFRSLVRSGVLTEPDKRLLVEHGVPERWLTIPGVPFRRRNRGPNGRVSRPLSEEDVKPLLDEGRIDTIWVLIWQGVITKEEMEHAPHVRRNRPRPRGRHHSGPARYEQDRSAGVATARQ
ncbi:hypothetical protein G1C97_2170 [Bifidobacterium sp. DSM 109959]|uniref:Uncharacterized protein n=2 Tax=Bifidobacterium olomucense TaxID=2675324 RepID=A0A7Y0HYD4_9BIFI|nr:hypothetical protein [Bifidobacterium sp. DSM 109959]